MHAYENKGKYEFVSSDNGESLRDVEKYEELLYDDSEYPISFNGGKVGRAH